MKALLRTPAKVCEVPLGMCPLKVQDALISLSMPASPQCTYLQALGQFFGTSGLA